jgi:hypothetical protein
MLRKSLAIAAAGAALAAPASALAMHGRGEPATRLPRNLESRGTPVQTVLVTAPAAQASFSWRDAGIGAAVTGGCVLMLAGGRRAVRLRHAS